jgi:hypothetical protein
MPDPNLLSLSPQLDAAALWNSGAAYLLRPECADRPSRRAWSVNPDRYQIRPRRMAAQIDQGDTWHLLHPPRVLSRRQTKSPDRDWRVSSKSGAAGFSNGTALYGTAYRRDFL